MTISSTFVLHTADTPRWRHCSVMPFTMYLPTASPDSGRWIRLTDAPPDVPNFDSVMPMESSQSMASLDPAHM